MSAPPPPAGELPPELAAVIGELTTLGIQLGAARYFALAAVVSLWYDAILTLDEEVSKMWVQPWSLAKALWFLHRYYNLCTYSVHAWGFLFTGWTEQSCKKYYLFPGISNAPTQMIVAIILTLRTWSLYQKSKVVLGVCISVYLCSLGLQVWPVFFAIYIPLPPPFKDCILGTPASLGNAPISVWAGTTVFDTVIFALTLARTLTLYRQGVRIPLVQLMLRDGILYFGSIVGVNMLMILTFVFAEGPVKVINAEFMHTTTVIVVSRLMLNLKAQAPEFNSPPSHGRYGDKSSGYPAAWSVEDPTQADTRMVPISQFSQHEGRRPSVVGAYPKPPPQFGFQKRADDVEMSIVDISAARNKDYQHHSQTGSQQGGGW